LQTTPPANKLEEAYQALIQSLQHLKQNKQELENLRKSLSIKRSKLYDESYRKEKEERRKFRIFVLSIFALALSTFGFIWLTKIQELAYAFVGLILLSVILLIFEDDILEGTIESIWSSEWKTGCQLDLVKECLLKISRDANKIEAALNSFALNGSIAEIRQLLTELLNDWAYQTCPYVCSVKGTKFLDLRPFKWVRDIYDSLYLNDVERLRRLVDEAREFLSKDYRRRHLIVEVDGFRSDFYLRFLEYHYLLANTVLLEYSARAPPAVGVEAPTVAVSSGGGWDNVLYEGRCRFKFGGVSQWRDGVIKITGKGLVLEGKLRVRSLNLTAMAIKAAARAAGIGEVHERISYESITSYDYNTRKGEVVIKAYGKKYVIKTDAAGHIRKYLDQFVKS